jgi:cell division protein FtsW
MSWSERFGSKVTGQRNAMPSDTLAGRSSAGASGTGTRGGISSAVSGVRPARSRMLDYDYSLLWVTIALLGLGVVMVYSASIAMPDSPKYASYRDYHFLVRHLISITTALVGAVIAFKIPIKTWEKYAPKC